IIHVDHHESACSRQAGLANRAFGSRLASRMPRALDNPAKVPCHAKNKALPCCASHSYSIVGRCRILANGVGSLSYWATTSHELRCFASQNGTRELGCQSGEDLSCAVFSAFLLGRLRTFWPRLFRAGPVGRRLRRQMAQCPRTAAPKKLVDLARTRPL